MGFDTKSGHYIASVLGPNDKWYRLNDTIRTGVTLEQARSYEGGFTPYILFYEETGYDAR